MLEITIGFVSHSPLTGSSRALVSSTPLLYSSHLKQYEHRNAFLNSSVRSRNDFCQQASQSFHEMVVNSTPPPLLSFHLSLTPPDMHLLLRQTCSANQWTGPTTTAWRGRSDPSPPSASSSHSSRAFPASLAFMGASQLPVHSPSPACHSRCGMGLFLR